MMRFAVAMLVIVLAACASGPARRADGCAIADRYIKAANSGDAARIAPWIADDATAIFLSPENTPRSALEGRDAVLEAVGTYTTQCPSCRSTLRCLHASPDGVHAIEDVTFTDQDGIERRQSAPVVFMLEDEHITAIVYYPEYATD